MSIKLKQGRCEAEGCLYEGPLIARKCKTHYWKHRAEVNKKKPENKHKTNERAKRKAELDKWFEKQIKKIPEYCEECGTNLGGWRLVMPRAIIAHILPKRTGPGGFPSVATHPENRMYYCPDCHNGYDNKGWSHVEKMKSFKKVKRRLQKFSGDLSEEEFNRIPEIFKL